MRFIFSLKNKCFRIIHFSLFFLCSTYFRLGIRFAPFHLNFLWCTIIAPLHSFLHTSFSYCQPIVFHTTSQHSQITFLQKCLSSSIISNDPYLSRWFLLKDKWEEHVLQLLRTLLFCTQSFPSSALVPKLLIKPEVYKSCDWGFSCSRCKLSSLTLPIFCMYFISLALQLFEVE